MTTKTLWMIDTTLGENIRIGHDLKSTPAIEYKPEFEQFLANGMTPTSFKLEQVIQKNNTGDEIRPNYYGGKENPYEVFKVVEAWGLDQDAYLFNVIKYVARCGKKSPNMEEDLTKALTYLQRRISTL
jgi:hypothetical protein